MKKYIYILILTLALFTARTVSASSDYISSGVLYFDPVLSAGTRIWYKGSFPDTSIVAVPSGAFAGTLQTLECGQICGASDGEHYWFYSPENDHYDEVVRGGGGTAWTLVAQGSYSGSNETQFTAYYLSTTTQTFRVTGYVNSEDENVHISFNVSTPLYSQWDYDDVVATTTYFDMSFPYQNFSTSTIEIFTFKATLYTPSLNVFDPLSPPTIYDEVSTTTDANGLGITHLPSPSEINDAVAANCNPFSSFYNVSACVSYLFFPNPEEARNNTNRIRNSLLVKAPIGYFTRFYTIITSTATTSIPSISYTWPSDGGPFSGVTWDLDVDNYMAQAAVLTSEMTSNTDDHKTAWEIFEPLINTFLAIVVLYSFIHDIMGLNLMRNKR